MAAVFIVAVEPLRATSRSVGLSGNVARCVALTFCTKVCETLAAVAIHRSDFAPHSTSFSSVRTARRLSSLVRRRP